MQYSLLFFRAYTLSHRILKQSRLATISSTEWPEPHLPLGRVAGVRGRGLQPHLLPGAGHRHPRLDPGLKCRHNNMIYMLLHAMLFVMSQLQTKVLVDPEGRWGHVSWNRGDQGVILMGGEVDIISDISICLSIISTTSIISIYRGVYNIYHIYLM